MSRCFSDVEDLLDRAARINDAEIARLPERVENSRSSARDTVAGIAIAAAAGRELREIGRRRVVLAVAALVLSIALVTLQGATAIAASGATVWRW